MNDNDREQMRRYENVDPQACYERWRRAMLLVWAKELGWESEEAQEARDAWDDRRYEFSTIRISHRH